MIKYSHFTIILAVLTLFLQACSSTSAHVAVRNISPHKEDAIEYMARQEEACDTSHVQSDFCDEAPAVSEVEDKTLAMNDTEDKSPAVNEAEDKAPVVIDIEDENLVMNEAEQIVQENGVAESDLSPAELLEQEFDELPLAPHQLVQGANYPTPDIPLYTNERIKNLIHLYSDRHRSVLQRAVKRSAKYMVMIQRIFRKNHIPGNLAYLAVVESNFNPHAKSYASAVGMWQFMKSTGRSFGLNINYWVDERYDAMKSTQAAAKYLHKLHQRLGSWELAIAAYNTGETNVRRAMRRNARKHLSQDFWSLDLPKETMNYVPAFYAVSILFDSLESYNFTTPKVFMVEAKTSHIHVGGGIELDRIASLIKVPRKTLRALNTSLFYNMTPIGKKKYQLTVPANVRVNKYIANKIAKLQTKGIKHYRVRQGDNLWDLARKFNLSIKRLRSINNLTTARIYVGQKLFLPLYSSHSRGNSSTINHNLLTYKVHHSDTLWDIARKYKVTVAQLKLWNNKDNSIVHVGEKLHIRLNSLVRR